MLRQIETEKFFGNSITITPYHYPDLDGVACAYAAAELITNQSKVSAMPRICQQPQLEAEWVIKELNITKALPPLTIEDSQTQIILVDVSDRSDLPDFLPCNQVIEVIDHRKGGDLTAFPNAVSQIEPVGAAATLIAEKFIRARLKPSQNSTILLYAAIASNTANFHTIPDSEVTFNRDMLASQWLKAQVEGVLLENFVHRMFLAKSDLSNLELKEVIDRDISSKFPVLGGLPTAVAQLELIGARELLVSRAAEIRDALAIIKKERGVEQIFLTAIDLQEGANYFMFTDKHMEALVINEFGGELNGGFWFRPKNPIALTRKQIISQLHHNLK